MSDDFRTVPGFTYQLCLDIDEGIKKRRVVAKTFFGDTKMYLAGDNFVFEHCYGPIASIDKDDVITLMNVPKWGENQTTQNRIQTLLSLGRTGWGERWFIQSDRSRHKSSAQPVRIWHGSRWKGDGDCTLPLTDGLQFKHGEMLNPEICVEKKLRTNGMPRRWSRRSSPSSRSC